MNKKDNHNIEPAANKKIGLNWVMLIYFCSGLCSLIDEVVWVRLLKLSLGNTVYASTIVVSMFMGGLALGSLIMARYADSIKRRLRLYAILEICVTISALCLPLALKFMDRFYQLFYLNHQPSPTTLLLLQVIVSAVILLVPAMLMGSTLPLLSRHVAVLEERVGHLVGRLYALNTLGATLGCFLAGFVLIRVAGVMNTLYIAAGINLLVALGGWILSLSHDDITRTADEKTALVQPHQVIDNVWYKKTNLLLLAVFASGFISIGYELIWMRTIAYRLGCYTYVFSAVLTIYLLGNVIGAWVGSRLSKRLKNPSIGFGFSMTFLGLFGLLFAPWISLMYSKPPEAFMKASTIQMTVDPLLHCLSLFLIPSIMMGIGFPLAIQTWNNYKQKVGATTGTVYGSNTIGAVLGGILTGFLLIPFLGAQIAITALGIGGVWIGISMVLIYDVKSSRTRRMGYFAIAVLFTAIGILIPIDLLNRSLIKYPGFNTIAVVEGLTTTASVRESFRMDNKKRTLFLSTSNMVIGGDGSMRSAQKTLGHLGVFLNKNSKEVLSIGFGTGETTDCLARHKLDQIDCVEIAPELVHMALKFFPHINLGDRLDQKVKMIYMDAKNYLHLTPKKYDIIINGANRPAQPGSAPMFAKEHFENCLAHLNKGGLVMTKLHITSMSESSFESTIGTFLHVFPHVTIWFPVTKPHLFFYLVGSREEQRFSPKYIEEQLMNESVRNSTAYLHFRNSIDVLCGYIGDENDLRAYLKTYCINSDYMPFLEFNIERETNLIHNGYFNQFLNMVRRESLVSHIDWSGMGFHEKSKWLNEYEDHFIAISYILQAHGVQAHGAEMDFFQKLGIYNNGLKHMPNYPPILDQQIQILQTIKSLLNKEVSAGVIYADIAISKIDFEIKKHPKSSALWLLKSWALKEQNKINAALEAGEKAVTFSPSNALAHENLAELFLELGQTDKAIQHLTIALQLDNEVPMLHFKMGEALAYQGDLSEAANSYQKALNLNPRFIEAQSRLEKVIAE